MSKRGNQHRKPEIKIEVWGDLRNTETDFNQLGRVLKPNGGDLLVIFSVDGK